MKIIAFQFGIITLSIVSISFVTSCHQNSNRTSSGTRSVTSLSEVDSLKEQLMTVHEVAMGKIAPLRMVEDSIREGIRMLAGDKKDTLKLSEVATEMNHYDTAMFGWMGRYHDQTMSPDSSNTALIKQRLQSLKRLNASMDSVIIRGRALLH